MKHKSHLGPSFRCKEMWRDKKWEEQQELLVHLFIFQPVKKKMEVCSEHNVCNYSARCQKELLWLLKR